MLIPILIGLTWNDAPTWVIQAAFIGSLVVIVGGLLTNRVALKCPYCGKRVKLFSSHCHHCGRQVTNLEDEPG